MKAIIEFNLPDEREEFELHNSAPSLNSALHDIYTQLRHIRKYETLNTTEQDFMERIWKIYCDATEEVELW